MTTVAATTSSQLTTGPGPDLAGDNGDVTGFESLLLGLMGLPDSAAPQVPIDDHVQLEAEASADSQGITDHDPVDEMAAAMAMLPPLVDRRAPLAGGPTSRTGPVEATPSVGIATTDHHTAMPAVSTSTSPPVDGRTRSASSSPATPGDSHEVPPDQRGLTAEGGPTAEPATSEADLAERPAPPMDGRSEERDPHSSLRYSSAPPEKTTRPSIDGLPVAGTVALGAAPAATHSSPISATSQPSVALPHQIVRVLAPFRRAADGTHHITLQVRPEHLGRVELELRVDGGQVSLHLRADTAATTDLLRSNLAELRSALEDAGLHAGSLDVGDQARSNPGDVPDQPQAPRSLLANRSTPVSEQAAPNTTVATAGGVDLRL